MKTRIIVDSTADLMPEYKERVQVVLFTVHFGNQEYIDGVTIDHKTFYEKLVESDAFASAYILPILCLFLPIKRRFFADDVGRYIIVIVEKYNLKN